MSSSDKSNSFCVKFFSKRPEIESKTIDILINNGFHSMVSLLAMDLTIDLNQLSDISVGQKAILRKIITSLANTYNKSLSELTTDGQSLKSKERSIEESFRQHFQISSAQELVRNVIENKFLRDDSSVDQNSAAIETTLQMSGDINQNGLLSTGSDDNSHRESTGRFRSRKPIAKNKRKSVGSDEQILKNNTKSVVKRIRKQSTGSEEQSRQESTKIAQNGKISLRSRQLIPKDTQKSQRSDSEEELHLLQRSDENTCSKGFCNICGDIGKYVYPSGVSCSPCYTFLNKHKGSGKGFSCVSGNNNCIITKSTRNDCRSCRWYKCIQYMADNNDTNDDNDNTSTQRSLQIDLNSEDNFDNDFDKSVNQSTGSSEQIPCKGVCNICGDIGKYVYPSGVSCPSCYSFHYRYKSLENEFTCSSGNNNCVITKSTRNDCRSCRLSKCVEYMADNNDTNDNDNTSTQRSLQIDIISEDNSDNDFDKCVNQSTGSSEQIPCKGFCNICGDIGKYVYPSAVLCSSCHSFYYKYNSLENEFTCSSGNNNCVITKITRKDCRSCRWYKCIQYMDDNNDTNYNNTYTQESTQMYCEDNLSDDSIDDKQSFDNFMSKSEVIVTSQPIIPLSRIKSIQPKRKMGPKSKTQGKGCSVCTVCANETFDKRSGILFCKGCQSFLRRVNNNRYDVKECFQKLGNCDLKAQGRQKCHYCRFNACIKAGFALKPANDESMSEEVVETNEELNESEISAVDESVGEGQTMATIVCGSDADSSPNRKRRQSITQISYLE